MYHAIYDRYTKRRLADFDDETGWVGSPTGKTLGHVDGHGVIVRTDGTVWGAVRQSSFYDHATGEYVAFVIPPLHE